MPSLLKRIAFGLQKEDNFPNDPIFSGRHLVEESGENIIPGDIVFIGNNRGHKFIVDKVLPGPVLVNPEGKEWTISSASLYIIGRKRPGYFER